MTTSDRLFVLFCMCLICSVASEGWPSLAWWLLSILAFIWQRRAQ